jgi:hypothetical protein
MQTYTYTLTAVETEIVMACIVAGHKMASEIDHSSPMAREMDKDIANAIEALGEKIRYERTRQS